MNFIGRYWAVLLIAFILIMLVILSYLIDKEMNRKNKKNETKNKKIYNYDLDNNKNDGVNEIKEEIIELNEKEKTDNEEKETLDYDELDVEDIDLDFDKVISKKHFINDDLINDIKNIKVDSVHIDKTDGLESIELPDIKIKKEIKDEDVWSKSN